MVAITWSAWSARLGHQRDMALVQVAHGRHQRDARPALAPCRAQAGDGFVDQHQ
jgi:hypothetical protein